MWMLFILAYLVGCFIAVVYLRYYNIRDNGDTAVRIPLSIFWPLVLPVYIIAKILIAVFKALSALADVIVRRLKTRVE